MAGNKYISNVSGVFTEVAASQSSAGATDANKVVALDSNGLINVNMMPVGIGADTATIIASEILAAGNLVNIWSNSGVANVRKADATSAGKEAHGFVLAATATAGLVASVYFEGNNNQVSGLTPGKQYLATTAGTILSAAPTLSGNVVQPVGFATSATNLNFQSGTPVTLA